MDASALRNFKDFLELYNKMTERCFSRCVDNMHGRKLDIGEQACVDSCADKFVKYNHKLMNKFMQYQSDIVNKRLKDMEEQAANTSQEVAVSA